jgi:hypothetical protein
LGALSPLPFGPGRKRRLEPTPDVVPVMIFRCQGTTLLACVLAVGASLRAEVAPDLGRVSDLAFWRVQNRTASTFEFRGRKGARLDARPDSGMAWLVGSDFSNGSIEVDLRGSNTPGGSFVGIAFHGVDRRTYDAVYFRPFNFQNPDLLHRGHSVQYISEPGFPWEKLRADSPGKFEQPIFPVPNPDAWFHARIVVEDGWVTVFVNGSATPSLVVRELGGRHGGLVGLWVGNGSAGDFANLVIEKNK